jgi:hypothetical protein
VYPIIDRPDWDHLDQWHQSGLWDADLSQPGPARVLHEPSAEALRQAQARVAAAVPPRRRQGVKISTVQPLLSQATPNFKP